MLWEQILHQTSSVDLIIWCNVLMCGESRYPTTFGPGGAGCCNFYCIKIKIYITEILLVVQVCGYETWSVTLRNRLMREDWYRQKCMNLEALCIKSTCKNFQFSEILLHDSRALFISTGMLVKVNKLRILSGGTSGSFRPPVYVHLCVELHVYSISSKYSSK